MQYNQYYNGTNNHECHNSNPYYWSILLKDIIAKKEFWDGKRALDFGCGKGRNVSNLLSLAKWEKVDGADISVANVAHCNELKYGNSTFFNTDGVGVRDLKDEYYDFIMSTIVLQHICVYDIRKNILTDLFRTMKSGGILSVQMGFGLEEDGCVNYYANNYEASSTNGTHDVRVTSKEQVVLDFEEIGFRTVTTSVRQSWEDANHPSWIYIRAVK